MDNEEEAKVVGTPQIAHLEARDGGIVTEYIDGKEAETDLVLNAAILKDNF